MEEQKEWIWLSRIEEVGSRTKYKLLEKYKTPGAILRTPKKELGKIEKIGPKKIEKLTEKRYQLNLDSYVSYMKENQIDMITIYDKEYPQKLKNIYDPPVVLYIKGNKKILNQPAIAMVGCRRCSSYGIKNAKKFAYNLSKYNINIVSGLARGIDTCSHLGALRAGGTTIAVVGCGLDRVYPPENKAVFEQIIQSGGAILSEYVIGTKPIGSNFPARNRIISGISNGVLIVEAKKRSGSLITAEFALEQGRDVYVIPGNIDSQNSEGTNRLIQDGAKLVIQEKDIIEETYGIKEVLF